MQLYNTVNSIQFGGKTFNYSKWSRRMLFLCLHRLIYGVCQKRPPSAWIWMFWVVHATGQRMRHCALFNAVPNVYLRNWKAWVMQQTKCRNSVTMASVSERKINKLTKTHETELMLPDIEHNIIFSVIWL